VARFPLIYIYRNYIDEEKKTEALRLELLLKSNLLSNYIILIAQITLIIQ